MIKLTDLLKEINEGVNDNFLYHTHIYRRLKEPISKYFLQTTSVSQVSFQ